MYLSIFRSRAAVSICLFFLRFRAECVGCHSQDRLNLLISLRLAIMYGFQYYTSQSSLLLSLVISVAPQKRSGGQHYGLRMHVIAC